MNWLFGYLLFTYLGFIPTIRYAQREKRLGFNRHLPTIGILGLWVISPVTLPVFWCFVISDHEDEIKTFLWKIASPLCWLNSVFRVSLGFAPSTEPEPDEGP
jgi:hypothetical protein